MLIYSKYNIFFTQAKNCTFLSREIQGTFTGFLLTSFHPSRVQSFKHRTLKAFDLSEG